MKKCKDDFKILLVDDDEMSLKSLHSFLSSEGYYVNSYSKPSTALKSMDDFRYHMILTDYAMPEMSGLKLIQLIRKNYPEIYTILYTGFSTEVLEDNIKKNISVNYFIKKPLRIKELVNIINNTIKLKSRRKR
ncbi:MAG: response regulator [Candidatus Cloacimonadota bacterium]|nr:response regulator [Candidatus Cloacimonadota bacterium]